MMVLLQELGLIPYLILDTTHQIIYILFWRYIFRVSWIGVLVCLRNVDFDFFVLNPKLNIEVDSDGRALIVLLISLFILRIRESKRFLILVDIIRGQKSTPHWRNILIFVAAGGMIVPMRIRLIRNRPLLSLDHRNFEKTFFVDYFFSYFSKC